MKQNPTLNYEQSLWNQGLTHVAGVDEVGRGCLAGPIVVGAVVFKPGAKMIDGVRDSKMLTAERRTTLAKQIKEHALHYSIGIGSVNQINQEGLMPTLKSAINSACTTLATCQHLLIDGRPFTSIEYQWPTTTYIIKGDALSYSIAAASIIAKVYRDQLMTQLAEEFPMYSWDQNAGYGTHAHRTALLQHGQCLHHRDLFLRKILK